MPAASPDGGGRTGACGVIPTLPRLMGSRDGHTWAVSLAVNILLGLIHGTSWGRPPTPALPPPRAPQPQRTCHVGTEEVNAGLKDKCISEGWHWEPVPAFRREGHPGIQTEEAAFLWSV